MVFEALILNNFLMRLPWQAREAGQKAETARRKQEANGYLASALESQRLGEYPASLQHIEQGLALVPDHDGLIRLRGEVREQFAEEQKRRAEQLQREQEIKALLERAEAQLAAKRLTQPTGDNAEETYQQLLKLDPENAQARAGFGRIAEEYERLARQRREVGALQDSLALIDRGLTVASKHEGLSRLRQEVGAEWDVEQKQLEQQRKEQQRKEQQERQHLEQQRKEQQERQRLEQQRKEQEQQKKEQQRNEQQRKDQERQRFDQQRLEQQRKEQQRLEEQRLEQQRLEQQRQEQQRREQQQLEQQRQQRQEQLPEKQPQPQPQTTTTKPRVFGTF
jgi:DNA repair exonuclease SbcCD ATPase subunit